MRQWSESMLESKTTRFFKQSMHSRTDIYTFWVFYLYFSNGLVIKFCKKQRKLAPNNEYFPDFSTQHDVLYGKQRYIYKEEVGQVVHLGLAQTFAFDENNTTKP